MAPSTYITILIARPSLLDRSLSVAVAIAHLGGDNRSVPDAQETGRTGRALLCVLAVIALAALLAYVIPRAASNRRAESRRSDARAAQASSGRGDSRESTVAAGDREAPANPRARILGRVYDFDTHDPVVGAVVRVAPAHLILVRGGRTCVTDSSGRFAFPVEGPGCYSVSVRSDRYVDRIIRDVRAREGAQAAIDIALTRGLVLTGRVIDAQTGEPLRSGRIGGLGACSKPDARIDSEGRFAVSGLTAPLEWFQVWRPGWSFKAVKSDPTANYDPAGRQIRAAVVRVSRAPALRGVVHGLNGKAVRGAAVAFSFHTISRQIERFDAGREGAFLVATTTNPEGRFELPSIGSSREGQLLVRHAN